MQCTDTAGAIQWQRFFYGDNSSETPRTRATNARGISVWPADSAGDTRVAICGEAYDIALPASQNSGGFTSASASHPNGFVAVLDGSGTLQWSYQFHGRYGTHDCAITDLSVRVETDGEDVYDVVTYCGISSHGVPDITTPLTPLLPFAAPLGTANCFAGGAGDDHNGTDQWDGIVGRLRHDRTAGTTARVFHSIVGGDEQDSLFGIAEIDEHRFAVVGSTARVAGSGASTRAFPFANSSATCWNNQSTYCVGVMAVFDASGTTSNQPLVLEAGHELGSVGTSPHSIARDIVVNRITDGESALSTFFIVGSTDDSSFISALPVLNGTTCAAGFQSTIGGNSDGFLLWGFVTPYSSGTPVTFYVSSFYGGSSWDGLTGVQSWNEYWGHAAVVGWTKDNPSNPTDAQVNVASILTPDYTAQTMSLVRQQTIGGDKVDLPTVLGVQNAVTVGLTFNEGGLGSAAGGGVTVDERARVYICGSSDTSGSVQYPVDGGGRSAIGGFDAVASNYEMLPTGVYRTDGTGTSNLITVPQPSSYDGGSTPYACVQPFGIRVDEATPEVTRILIDYDGPDPAPGVTAELVAVGLPLLNGAFIGALIQYGAPASTPYVPTGTTLEQWATNSPVTLMASGTGRWPLFPSGMPSGVNAFTVQVTVLLSSSLSCDPSNAVASPGLVFDY